MLDNFLTFLTFIFALALTPGLFICYLFVRLCRTIWLHTLSTIHPDVEFIRSTTVRTLSDTHRNQGIFTVLLRIADAPRIDLVRRHIYDVVTRVDKVGELRFPKLSMLLVSRWGSYAWKKLGKEFSIDKVVLVGAKTTHRGRPVTEGNIQEHVSDIVTRYLPRGVPPWQLVILPCSNSDSHYLLLRMHHLLLTDGDINIADLLPIASSSEFVLEHDNLQHHLDSPLINVLERPEHIRSLYSAIIEHLTNRWNEFTSNYDPMHKPEMLKRTPVLGEFAAIVLVALVAIARRIMLGSRNVNPELTSRIKYIRACIKHELNARNISFKSFLFAFFATIHPWHIITSILQLFYDILANIFYKIPLQILCEIQALLRRLLNLRNENFTRTNIDMIFDCSPMIYRAGCQIWKYAKALYSAPRIFIDELLVDRGWPGDTAVPLCGRKVVAWSKPISGEQLRDIKKATGLSCTEVLLTALGFTIGDFYSESGTKIPNLVPITARRISAGYLFARGPNVRPQDAVSGLLCLKVPTTVSDSNDCLASLETVAENIRLARQKQGCVYAMTILQTKHRIATKALPSVLVSILLRNLSKKYTISVTELAARDEIGAIRSTTWGAKITDIIYWRPPQANISVSLCLNYYGDQVTLAVMCDALLSPHHMPLADKLPQHVEKLAQTIIS